MNFVRVAFEWIDISLGDPKTKGVIKIMVKKWRSAESYYGNTAEARRNQRANLIPGNAWRKRKTRGLRLDCFWEDGDFGNRQMIYEDFVNGRDYEKVDKKELKDEKFLTDWWEYLDLEDKKLIYKEVMSWQDPEFKARHLKRINKCLKKKLSLSYKR